MGGRLKIFYFSIGLQEVAVGCYSVSLSKVFVVKDNLVDPVSRIQPFDPHNFYLLHASGVNGAKPGRE